MGELLNREKLLTRDKLLIEKVTFDDKNFVYVRQMTGRERDQFERSLMMPIKTGRQVTDFETRLEDFRAKLAVNTLCDEKGNMLLKANDYEKLSTSMSAAKLEQIVAVASRLNAISEKDKEALTKNSDAIPHADSSSGSAGK